MYSQQPAAEGTGRELKEVGRVAGDWEHLLEKLSAGDRQALEVRTEGTFHVQ